MTPIEKNVRVVDEQGNEYEATYPKRAKGLVKNGRARFADENTICLACPPEKFNFTEDNIMTDNSKINVNKITGEVTENTAKTEEMPAEGFSKYTLDYALEQLEKVRCESAKFAVETRENIGEIKSAGPGDIGAEAAGDALRTLIQEQEQNYRRLIDFYIEMINELKPHDAKYTLADREQFLDFVRGCVTLADPKVGYPDFEEIWEIMHS